jgi:2-polyprenyl-6-methoxyphenol hydroxylase-like FAD-dependent oxidoreductase
LIGDASAAFLPSAGVGASAAMESAAVLADELSRADARRLDLAIKLFEARRMHRVHKMQDDSRLLWRLAFTENAVLTGARNLLLGHVSSEQFLRNFEGLLEQPI